MPLVFHASVFLELLSSCGLELSMCQAFPPRCASMQASRPPPPSPHVPSLTRLRCLQRSCLNLTPPFPLFSLVILPHSLALPVSSFSSFHPLAASLNLIASSPPPQLTLPLSPLHPSEGFNFSSLRPPSSPTHTHAPPSPLPSSSHLCSPPSCFTLRGRLSTWSALNRRRRYCGEGMGAGGLICVLSSPWLASTAV